MEKGSFGKASFGKAFEYGVSKGLEEGNEVRKKTEKVPEEMASRLSYGLGLVAGKTAKALDVLQFFSGQK